MNTGIERSIAAIMPALLQSGLMGSLCTIMLPPSQQTPGLFDDGGAAEPAPFVALGMVAGLSYSNIPCRAAPPSVARVQATEVKALAEIMSESLLHVLLGGYYPAIIAGYRAVIDGVAFEILGAEDDGASPHIMTRLAVRLVTV